VELLHLCRQRVTITLPLLNNSDNFIPTLLTGEGQLEHIKNKKSFLIVAHIEAIDRCNFKQQLNFDGQKSRKVDKTHQYPAGSGYSPLYRGRLLIKFNLLSHIGLPKLKSGILPRSGSNIFGAEKNRIHHLFDGISNSTMCFFRN